MTTHVRNTNLNQEDEGVLASAVIPPHEMRPVFVDEYEDEELAPRLTVEALADGWDIIGWAPNRKRLPDGTLHLSVMVQNFTDRPVTVRIRQDDEGR
ncbi:hypothetical protein ACWD0Z_10200 [Streptomyces sp. NPDC003007]